jgi:hypothetical protein
MGSVASVMGYSKANYVAQPEDKIPLRDRFPRIGPYDRWAIAWGYCPIPEAASPEAEQPTLNQWLAAQDTAPYLRASLGLPFDPADYRETMGDDPVKSADYAFRNLERLAAAVVKPGQDTMTFVSSSAIADEWQWKLTLAAKVVGGVTPEYPGLRLVPIDSARQVQALRFVLGHLFYGQDELVKRHVVGLAPAQQPPPLVLFDTAAPGWNRDQWQRFQSDMMAHLLGQMANLSAEQAGTRTALCQDVAGLRERLAVAAAAAQGAAHVRELTTVVEGFFQPYIGVCP